MDPLSYTIAEAHERARLGRTKIYEAINTGDLRAVKCGRRTLILHDDLVRYLQSLPTIKAEQGSAVDARVSAEDSEGSTIKAKRACTRRGVW